MQTKSYYAYASASNIPPAIDETDKLIREVHRLLVYSEDILKNEGVKERAETLEWWLDSYRRGLSAAQKLSENSREFLTEMRDKVELALKEMQRLEDEGGNLPVTKEQRQRVEDLTHAIRRIEKLIDSLGNRPFRPSRKTA